MSSVIYIIHRFEKIFLTWLVFLPMMVWAGSGDSALYLKKTISGSISPKSVVHNGAGIFFAQNMMYRHTVTVYDRSYNKVATIKDGLNPADFGLKDYNFNIKGGPVECAFSHNGKYAWVSNYSISGGDSTQFVHPGCDNCSGTGKYDSSFLYKIEVATQKVEAVIKVGSVPKYVAVSPDNKWVLVTNWSSGDMSIVDVSKSVEVKRLKLGTFPRGIVVDPNSKYAYATVMGSTKLARIDLEDFSVEFINDVGKGPRHLCISPDGKWLYLTLNTENRIAKIDLKTWEIKKLKVGQQPRSMAISGNGKFLYLVNYNDNTFSKINTSTFEIVAISKTKSHPIGITYDDLKEEVWVACYSGYIQVYKDSLVPGEKEIPVQNELETDQLAIASESNALVGQFGETEKNKEDLNQDSVIAKTNDIAPVVSREMLPVRRMYLDYKKSFNLVSKKVEPEIIQPEKTSKPSYGVKLDNKKEYLVIVGSFGEYNNALTMVDIMKGKGMVADHFKKPNKVMNYVFVYSSDSLSEAQEWANNNVPSDIEFWVMHQ